MCMSNFCMSTELVPRIDTLVTRYNRTATPFSRTATAASDRQGRTNCPSDYPWARSSPSPSARFGRRCTAVRPVEPPELSSAHRPAGVWVMRADQLVAPAESATYLQRDRQKDHASEAADEVEGAAEKATLPSPGRIVLRIVGSVEGGSG